MLLPVQAAQSSGGLFLSQLGNLSSRQGRATSLSAVAGLVWDAVDSFQGSEMLDCSFSSCLKGRSALLEREGTVWLRPALQCAS